MVTEYYIPVGMTAFSCKVNYTCMCKQVNLRQFEQAHHYALNIHFKKAKTKDKIKNAVKYALSAST